MRSQDVDVIMRAIEGIFQVPKRERDALRLVLARLKLTGKSNPKTDWVESARAVAMEIARRNHRVTIEDVLAECPLPPDLDPRCVGGVFKTNIFTRIGDQPIRTDDGRYKIIGVFSLTEPPQGSITNWS